MSEHEQQPDEQDVEDLELTDEQAEQVAGGATFGEIVITKPIDKGSPGPMH